MVRSMHDEVDALDDGGWWEGRVTQVGKQRYKVQPFISNTLLTVKRADVRTGVVWSAGDWSLRQAPGQCTCLLQALVKLHVPILPFFVNILGEV